MSIWIIPVRMKTADIYVAAPRVEVFRTLTSFVNESSTSGPTVLDREVSGAFIVEFKTTVKGMLGGEKTHRTVERVILDEPQTINFRGLQGPLDLLQDRISLTQEGPGTRVRYESTVGLKGSVFGWLLARLYVRPVLSRFMVGHLRQLRDSIE
ncbi:MAG: SRPBCC family protein [Dehalococcoidia bacterium]